MAAKSTDTDNILLQLMSKDNQDAFNLIYERYWEILFMTAAKALRGKQEAEDVVQDVFLSLWNRRKEINIEGSLSAYLQTCVRYKATHYIEKHITRRDYLALLTDVAINSSSPPSPEIQIQLKEVEETIRDTVSKMPHKMKEVYCLSRHEHLTHKEIAERLEITTETVKKHIQHALQLIKTALGHHPLAASFILPGLYF